MSLCPCLQHEQSQYSSLDFFLYGIDRNMLVLNLKAYVVTLRNHLNQNTDRGNLNSDPFLARMLISQRAITSM